IRDFHVTGVQTCALPIYELRGRRVAVPGERTSAYLALKLFQPDVETEVVPFDRIMEHVAAGKADVGLLIHEGQLTYADEGLHLRSEERRVGTEGGSRRGA